VLSAGVQALNAATAKSADKAKVFFIEIKFSCLLKDCTIIYRLIYTIVAHQISFGTLDNINLSQLIVKFKCDKYFFFDTFFLKSHFFKKIKEYL